MQQFWDRKEAAIQTAKKQYERYCRNIANNVLQNRLDAEECRNDAPLAAWDSIPPQRPRNLKTYLGKLIREIAVNRWHRNRAQKRITSESIVSPDELEEMVGTSTVEEAAEEADLAHEIFAFLRRLPETQRNLFIRFSCSQAGTHKRLLQIRTIADTIEKANATISASQP